MDARELEGRLLAPCCWAQTLDVHESDQASALRKEIAQRLKSGEPSAAIEDDFAARFGERVRAVPKGKDPLAVVPVIVGSGMLAILVGLLLLVRLWRRRTQLQAGDAAAVPARHHTRDDYDDRLEQELARIE